jgi:succinyl-diaminopimelate desuccinylase
VTDAACPLELSRALIRCPSVTPADAGAIDVLIGALEPLGFTCHRLVFAEPGTPDIVNLYARIGTEGPNFCFAGHTDVVPVGDEAAWTHAPFGAEVANGQLWGRGASDMKCADAAFTVAAARFLAQRGKRFKGSISLLITGDEEGPAINGTRKVLDWMKAKGERIDACVVGEPTNPKQLGDMIKNGRRGSLNATVTVFGRQGHVAYPHLADNPIHRLIRLMHTLIDHPLDHGNANFQPSSLQFTTVDVGNPTTNVIPASASARLNIRFNDEHTGASLERWLRQHLDGAGLDYALDVRISGESFATQPGPLTTLVSNAVQAVTGRTPELSTTGGTSDARFIKDFCPVVEFGLVGATMHGVDEHVAVADVHALADIYRHMLDHYFPE